MMKIWPCLVLLLGVVLNARAEEFVSHDGVRIHYVVQGQGRGAPVVLLHGLHGSAASNWTLPGITAALAQSRRVIAMDARGHGQSDKPLTEAEYGVCMVKDVIALLDRLDIRKAHLVGYSMGGMMAMKTAVLYPARVQTLMLCGMGWLQEGGRQQDLWEHMPMRERLRGGTSSSACMRGMAHLAVTAAQVKALRMPAAVIVGGRDPVDRAYVAPLAQIRPDWRITRISGAGHINCVMRPEFREAVVAELARLERG